MRKTFGSLVLDLLGKELQPEERELIEHPLVGGVILFSRNYESPEQLLTLVKNIRQAKDKPLLIMVDQEGGRVQRFRQDFTLLPPAAQYAQRASSDLNLSLQLAEAGGWIMAIELLARGIDLSLAPVLDLAKGVSSIIGDRAFHSDPAQAIKLATAYIEGMKTAGMAATGKHFPGHGSVAPDSHLELPLDTRSWAEIEKEDLAPFVHFVKQKIPALMTAHITFPEVDALPVSYSRRWIEDILRKQLGYTGVIMSDDLEMKGAAGISDYADRLLAARAAGCDLILLCNNRPATLEVLDRVPYTAHLLPLEKYESLRGNFDNIDLYQKKSALWQEKRDLLLKSTALA